MVSGRKDVLEVDVNNTVTEGADGVGSIGTLGGPPSRIHGGSNAALASVPDLRQDFLC